MAHVAFLGVRAMGLGMAARLVAAGERGGRLRRRPGGAGQGEGGRLRSRRRAPRPPSRGAATIITMLPGPAPTCGGSTWRPSSRLPRRARWSSTARPSTWRAPARWPRRPPPRASRAADAPSLRRHGGHGGGYSSLLHGRLRRRPLRDCPPATGADGARGGACRRRRRRAGREDLQQHGARHFDAGRLRGLRAGGKARPRAGAVL